MQKKFNFWKFVNLFADSKSRAQELSNDESIVIFGHQTWDLEGGGGQIDPTPQRILVFKYPSRDRVKVPYFVNYKLQSRGLNVSVLISENCEFRSQFDLFNIILFAIFLSYFCVGFLNV